MKAFLSLLFFPLKLHLLTHFLSFTHFVVSHLFYHRRNLRKNESCGDTKTQTYFIIVPPLLKKKSPRLPTCPYLRLFSLFYDCAPVSVSPCHHGNPLSLLFATHCVCAECSAITPRYLYSAAQEYLSVCVPCVQ